MIRFLTKRVFFYSIYREMSDILKREKKPFSSPQLFVSAGLPLAFVIKHISSETNSVSSSQLQHTTWFNLFFWLCNVSPEVQLRCQRLRTYLWLVVCFLLEEILFRHGSELSCQTFNKIWEKWWHYLCFGFMHWLPVCFKWILRAYCWLLRLYMVSPQVIYLSF